MVPSELSQRVDFRTLVDHLDKTAIWTISEMGSFEYISDGFEEIWQMPKDELLENPARLIERVHPDDRGFVQSQIEADDNETAETEYVCRILRPSGEVRWVKVQQVPLHDSNGQLTNVVGISTDITDQKRREQELEVLNRLLRHDIRNDMNVILGWASALGDHVDDVGKDQLERIVTSGEHVVELTDIARDYVETVTGDADLPVKPTPLRSTLKREIDLRRETYPNVEFVVHGDVPEVDVRANELLSSVFRNLLNNAVQHNDKDDPVVDIRAEEDGRDVTVAIEDNGPGIPDEQKESVFGKGQMGLGSPGTGIGLYLVQTLVDEYGGEVWVEDNEPTGAIVRVRLPKTE